MAKKYPRLESIYEKQYGTAVFKDTFTESVLKEQVEDFSLNKGKELKEEEEEERKNNSEIKLKEESLFSKEHI